jgi:hypothetical protein
LDFEKVREEGRRKKEEGRRKKEEGRRKKEEGRRKKEEGNLLPSKLKHPRAALVFICVHLRSSAVKLISLNRAKNTANSPLPITDL